MKFVLTAHAKKRMVERTISDSLIAEALYSPTKVLRDNKGNILIKKLYKKQGKDRLLLIVGERLVDSLKIITVIDTSKIKKYL